MFSSQAFDLAENFASDSHLEEDGLVLGDEQNLGTVGRSSVPPLVWPHNSIPHPYRESEPWLLHRYTAAIDDHDDRLRSPE